MTNQYEMAAKMIRDYIDKNNLGNFEKPEMEEMFSTFQKEFSPEILKELEGKDVLNKIFLHDDKSTLMYNIEYNLLYNPVDSIRRGSATNYTLFKAMMIGNMEKVLKKFLKMKQ